MAERDNRALITPTPSGALPVATRAPLPPLGAGTVGPNISPYAVAAAQAPVQPSQTPQRQYKKATPYKAPQAKQYAPPVPTVSPITPDQPPSAPKHLPLVPTQGPIIYPAERQAAVKALEDYYAAQAEPQYTPEEGQKEQWEAFDYDRMKQKEEDALLAQAQADAQPSGEEESERPDYWEEAKAKIAEGTTFVTDEDMEDKFESIDTNAELALQDQMNSMNSQLASMGIAGSGMRAVAMGNIRAKVLADANDLKTTIWLDSKKLNAQLEADHLRTMVDAAKTEGSWDHAEMLQERGHLFEIQQELFSALDEGIDQWMQRLDAHGIDPASKQRIYEDFEKCHDEGSYTCLMKILGGVDIEKGLLYYSGKDWRGTDEILDGYDGSYAGGAGQAIEDHMYDFSIQYDGSTGWQSHGPQRGGMEDFAEWLWNEKGIELGEGVWDENGVTYQDAGIRFTKHAFMDEWGGWQVGLRIDRLTPDGWQTSKNHIFRKTVPVWDTMTIGHQSKVGYAHDGEKEVGIIHGDAMDCLRDNYGGSENYKEMIAQHWADMSWDDPSYGNFYQAAFDFGCG